MPLWWNLVDTYDLGSYAFGCAGSSPASGTKLEINMWISVNDQEPEKGRDLWYYFHIVGVHRGQYYGDDLFGGIMGWLDEDVTHWQYDTGQDRPLPPSEAFTDDEKIEAVRADLQSRCRINKRVRKLASGNKLYLEVRANMIPFGDTDSDTRWNAIRSVLEVYWPDINVTSGSANRRIYATTNSWKK